MAGLPNIAALPSAPSSQPDSPLALPGTRPGGHRGSAAAHFTRAFHDTSRPVSLSRQKRTRESLLLTFIDPLPKECLRLWLLTRAEWQEALHWLDTAGLALYFLGRLQDENLDALLPDWVQVRLNQNLADNKERTAAFLAESHTLHARFQSAGLSYATLKGFSLDSHSVPRLELRSQLDFDFLVAQSSAPEARRILEDRGFALRGYHGRSWEFSAHDDGSITIRDLYKPIPHRWVELHIEADASPLLQRAEMRRMHGTAMPVLDPVDLFLGQGLHIYKHLRYEVTRPSHLLEFRRHIVARSDDDSFWRELHARAALDPRHPIGLGVVILLIERLMGPFAPPALTHWTVDNLPPAVRLWIETCAHAAILVDPPGTKLYLLLQEALASSGIPATRSVRRALVPNIVPHSLRPLISRIVAHRPADSRSPAIVARGPRKGWRRHLRLLASRLHFHLFEDLRYLREAHRFRKALSLIAP
jgi:hypothetical protein